MTDTTRAALKTLAASLADLVLQLDQFADSMPSVSPHARATESEDMIDWGDLIDAILAANQPTRAMQQWKSEGIMTGIDGAKSMLAGIKDFYEMRGELTGKQISIIKMCCPSNLRW